MTIADLLIVGGAFGIALIVPILIWLRRTGPGRVSGSVRARMSRPGEIVNHDIKRTDRLRSTGKEFLAQLYQLHMLRRLRPALASSRSVAASSMPHRLAYDLTL